MKKITLLFAAFCGIVLAANAQLKVDSVGKTILGTYNQDLTARLTVKAKTTDTYAARFTGVVRCDNFIDGRVAENYGVLPLTMSYISNALGLISHLHPAQIRIQNPIMPPLLDNMDGATATKDSNTALNDFENEEDNSVFGPLRPTYSFKYGIPINELSNYFPLSVLTDADGNNCVNYAYLVPFLVQAINELQDEISDLRGARSTGDSETISGETLAPSPSRSNNGIHLPAATLYQNTPNPFSERTVIRFTLPEEAQNAYIYIFDMQGKMQKQIPVNASMQSVTINGYELSAGMYIYSLVINGQEIDTKRMILSK